MITQEHLQVLTVADEAVGDAPDGYFLKIARGAVQHWLTDREWKQEITVSDLVYVYNNWPDKLNQLNDMVSGLELEFVLLLQQSTDNSPSRLWMMLREL